MPVPRKRPYEVIDLTEDSAAPPAKRAGLGNEDGGPHTSIAPSSRASSSVYSASHSKQSRVLSSSSWNSSAAPSSASSYVSASQADAEVLDLTQSDDGPPRELYGTFDNKIVGVRYYNGVATPGELVVCIREPNNEYDRNAIRVDNVFGHQIGHMPRTVVSRLATYVDSGDIAIEAKLIGEKGLFDCPIRVSLYGTSVPFLRSKLEDRLKQDKLLKATQLKQTRQENDARRKLGLRSGRGSAGFAPDDEVQPALTLQQLTAVSQAIDLRMGDSMAATLALSEEDLAKMPMAEQPEALKAHLLPYQLQGLAWMTKKEAPQLPKRGSKEVVQLWKRSDKGNYTNTATNFTVAKPPDLLSGGILADDMGLGKTIQIISLILTGGGGPTLIIAPVSVMSNWEQQVRRHVRKEMMPRLLIHHGNTRSASAQVLSEYDIVITSYGTMSSENPKGPLFGVDWRRVVLDEGHTIRNAKTKIAIAACGLKAKSRWVLSGTPIINNIRDLHSLLKFFGITGGVEQSEIFNTVIARPLAYGDKVAEALLQSLMQDLCLRRKKDMKFVDLNLPKKTEYVHRITFWDDEQKKYDALLAEAKGALEDLQTKSKDGQKGRFQSVLERLLRLRQTCCHWTLCRERINDLLKLLEDQDVVALTEETEALLREALSLYVQSQEDCSVCLGVLQDDPVITHCKHAFCRKCIMQVIEGQGKCPLCRASLTEDKLVELTEEEEGEEDLPDSERQSSKTEALMTILQAALKNKGSKIVIFSQWTSFLNVIQHQLDAAGYTYTRIDGSMTAARRDTALRALDDDPKTRILLASLSVCSVGLNLVAADTVVLADSWWAPAIEDQAVDRVHRLGQTRETTVWRLVMEGSVEERVLEVQAEKRELVGKAFQERDGGKGGRAKESRMADVIKLLS